MISQMNRRTWALALGLAAAASAAAAPREARAAAIPYATIGTVNTPAGGIPGLVYFDGKNSGTATVGADGSVDLGNFVVSSLAKTGTTNVNYVKDPFQIIVSSGQNASMSVNGVIDGSVGPNIANPALTATITSVAPYGNTALPFQLNLPMNTPLKLAVTDGTGPAATTFTGASTPVPEPASLAVFAAALGGLGLWRRRAAR